MTAHDRLARRARCACRKAPACRLCGCRTTRLRLTPSGPIERVCSGCARPESKCDCTPFVCPRCHGRGYLVTRETNNRRNEAWKPQSLAS